VSSSSGEVASYAQGQNIDEPLAMDRSGTVDYYEQDGLGSVTSLTSATGTVAQSYTYDSFGNTTNSSGSLTNFFRYTGREFDTETGLYYLRARYLDPTTGRFISEDPIGLGGGIDFYRYADNNPVIYTDLFGLTCHCTYHQKTGDMDCTPDNGGQPFSGHGYSGHGPGLNNPGQQGTKYYPGVPGSYGGPIPVGNYGIGSPTTLIGPTTIPLTPLPGTNTFGRNGFFIHGDNSAQNNSASEGCIVLPPGTRKKIANCNGGTLQVVP
jgi:RHS repeat-associated protein